MRDDFERTDSYYKNIFESAGQSREECLKMTQYVEELLNKYNTII
jgi:hypothetical protein